MTILQHHKQKEFGNNTYFKVKIPKSFKVRNGEIDFTEGYLFHLADGNFVVRPHLKERTPAYITLSPIGSLQVLKRFN